MKYVRIHTLEKGWHDRDNILLHAAFQILVDFVDKERPDESIDWNADELHKHAWEEIQDLYDWWKIKRPARKSPLDDKKLKAPPMRFKKILGSECRELIEPDKKKHTKDYDPLEKHSKLEKQWEEEDQRNLHRLVDIRGFLWT